MIDCFDVGSLSVEHQFSTEQETMMASETLKKQVDDLQVSSQTVMFDHQLQLNGHIEENKSLKSQMLELQVITLNMSYLSLSVEISWSNDGDESWSQNQNQRKDISVFLPCMLDLINGILEFTKHSKVIRKEWLWQQTMQESWKWEEELWKSL